MIKANHKYLYLLVAGFFTGILSACEKEDFTLPAETAINIEVLPENSNSRISHYKSKDNRIFISQEDTAATDNPGMPENPGSDEDSLPGPNPPDNPQPDFAGPPSNKEDPFTKFNSFTVFIKSFQFSGYRENAEDYFFDVNIDKKITLTQNALKTLIDNYDIPQGIYNRIEFTLTIVQNKKSNDSLYIEGNYLSKDHGPVPVTFTTTGKELELELTLNKETAIKANNSNKINLQFNFKKWQSSAQKQTWSKSKLNIPENGNNPNITISPKNNTLLYQTLENSFYRSWNIEHTK